MKLTPGKVNVVLDGQFGSTGKGVFCAYVAVNQPVDISITNASANAGHTFYYHGRKYVLKHLPVSGVIRSRNTIYLCPGAIIDPDVLLKEIEDTQIDPERVVIHPRCAVITEEDRAEESEGLMPAISSTQSGVGCALSRKVVRSSGLAEKCGKLQRFVREIDLQRYLDEGLTALMEVPQGYDLSLSSGYAYPFCTSREVTVPSALSDAQLHPSYLGKVALCLRSYPIRVGNGSGFSGPFYPDSLEVSWEEIGVPPERTTVTDKVRRVATFSYLQYWNVLRKTKPDYVFLNFCNYIKRPQTFLENLPEVTHVGYGPNTDNIRQIKTESKS